ncbi:MAG: cytochrome P450 [Actinobacteria bacterium]|nr:cytochrome P450 [Actinomycetota bacterium]
MPPAAIRLTDPDLYASGDPHEIWQWLRHHDPVRWQPPGELPGFWIVTRYHDVRAVYRSPATFSSAHGILLRPADHGADPGGGRTLALTDPPRHRQLREVVDRWFTVRAARALEGRMRDVARTVIGQAAERQECDFVADVAARVPLYVSCHLMGVPRPDWDHLAGLASEAFGAADALGRRLAHLEILRYFEHLQAARRKDPADDLVTALVTARPGGRPLTPDEVILNCDNLLVGGTENVRIAAAGGMLAFLQHPAEWRLLAQDPGLLPAAVAEVLRWTSSATHIMRMAVRPASLRGKPIKAGERVTLWNPSANRDESVFDDPHRFRVQRQPNRHLAFGSGEHFCLGGTLARSELRILYGELLRRRIRVEQAGSPVRLRSIVVNGLERLPVRLLA